MQSSVLFATLRHIDRMSICEGNETHMHQPELLHNHCKISMHAPSYACTGKHITDTLTTRSSTTTLSKGLLNKASSCLPLLTLLTIALSGKLYPKVNSVFQPPYRGNLGRISACTLLAPWLRHEGQAACKQPTMPMWHESARMAPVL